MSGGLDSGVLLSRLLAKGVRVIPVFIRCGLVWERAELYWLRRFLRAMRTPRLERLRVLDVPLQAAYGRHWSLTGHRVPGLASPDRAVYLPGRNLLLLGHAAVLCACEGTSTLYLGTLSGNPFADATPRFFRSMARCASQALSRPLRIRAPLRKTSKAALLRTAGRLPWHLTFSCLSPRGLRHCGRCNKCAERRRAFRAASLADRTGYAGAAA